LYRLSPWRSHLVDLRTIRTFENFRPLVIRIDDLGRAEAINYHNFEYKPQDAEAKYFLSEFTKLFYRRNRYHTIQDDFAKSLYFLDGKLANGILDAYRKDDIIRKFLINTAASEIDIDVKKVALEELQTAALPRARGLLHGVLLARRSQRIEARPVHGQFCLHLSNPRAKRTHPDQSTRPYDHLLPRRPGIQMKVLQETTSKEVAGGRLASSAQPPRATSFPTPPSSSQLTPQPIPSTPFLETPGALLEGLRCFYGLPPASRPGLHDRKKP